jgi:hypothetical protein
MYRSGPDANTIPSRVSRPNTEGYRSTHLSDYMLYFWGRSGIKKSKTTLSVSSNKCFISRKKHYRVLTLNINAVLIQASM